MQLAACFSLVASAAGNECRRCAIINTIGKTFGAQQGGRNGRFKAGRRPCCAPIFCTWC